MSKRNKLFVLLFRFGAACAIVAIWLHYLLQSYDVAGPKAEASIQFESPAASGGPVLNRIAFSGNEGHIWVVSPDGEELVRISTDWREYQYPTWSPDGRHLAFTSWDSGGGAGLFVSPADRSASTPLAVSVKSRPFYTYWSPDSQSITYLARERQGTIMRQVELSDPSENRRLGAGAPFYWAWSPNGDAVIMHERGHIVVMEAAEEVRRIELAGTSHQFQAPVWSADGSTLYYVGTDRDGRAGVIAADRESFETQKLVEIDGVCRMVASSRPGLLAYLTYTRRGKGGGPDQTGKAAIWDARAGERELKVEGFRTAALYWSPDASKLALLMVSLDREQTPRKLGTRRGASSEGESESPSLFHWWVYDMTKQALSPLVTFSPTRDLLATVAHFDQYHFSHSFWSPDSRYLVTCAQDTSPLEGTVWVVDTTEEEEPRLVGAGGFAVWSWQ